MNKDANLLDFVSLVWKKKILEERETISCVIRNTYQQAKNG
jgi:hypothetical protein